MGVVEPPARPSDVAGTIAAFSAVPPSVATMAVASAAGGGGELRMGLLLTPREGEGGDCSGGGFRTAPGGGDGGGGGAAAAVPLTDGHADALCGDVSRLLWWPAVGSLLSALVFGPEVLLGAGLDGGGGGATPTLRRLAGGTSPRPW